jgi:hypothetical protein
MSAMTLLAGKKDPTRQVALLATIFPLFPRKEWKKGQAHNASRQRRGRKNNDLITVLYKHLIPGGDFIGSVLEVLDPFIQL